MNYGTLLVGLREMSEYELALVKTASDQARNLGDFALNGSYQKVLCDHLEQKIHEKVNVAAIELKPAYLPVTLQKYKHLIAQDARGYIIGYATDWQFHLQYRIIAELSRLEQFSETVDAFWGYIKPNIRVTTGETAQILVTSEITDMLGKYRVWNETYRKDSAINVPYQALLVGQAAAALGVFPICEALASMNVNTVGLNSQAALQLGLINAATVTVRQTLENHKKEIEMTVSQHINSGYQEISCSIHKVLNQWQTWVNG